MTAPQLELVTIDRPADLNLIGRITRVDDRTVLAAGSMTIDDFNELLGTSLPQDGPLTSPGWSSTVSGAARRPATLSAWRESRCGSSRSTARG